MTRALNFIKALDNENPGHFNSFGRRLRPGVGLPFVLSLRPGARVRVRGHVPGYDLGRPADD